MSRPARRSHQKSGWTADTAATAVTATWIIRVAKTSKGVPLSEVTLEGSVRPRLEAEPRVVRGHHVHRGDHGPEAAVAQHTTASPHELAGGEVPEARGHVVEH